MNRVHPLDHELSSDISQFIRSERGSDIGRLVDLLEAVGPSAIFGGLPRDFARDGSSSFDSDVDVVVDAPAAALDACLQPMGAERNRFGGYRLRFGRFDFDVWALERTWAASTGQVAVRTLSDLVKTTFFDCDAILYHCQTAAISRPSAYWSKARRHVIDINLEANPHQVGTLVRTLRALFDWQQDLSPKLANYLVLGLAEHHAAVLQYALAQPRTYRFARELDLDATLTQLHHHRIGTGLCSHQVTRRRQHEDT